MSSENCENQSNQNGKTIGCRNFTYHSEKRLWQASFPFLSSELFKAFKHRPIRHEEYNFGKAKRTRTPLVYSNKTVSWTTECSDLIETKGPLVIDLIGEASGVSPGTRTEAPTSALTRKKIVNTFTAVIR